LLLAVLILAIGAIAITGLRLSQQRILESHRDQRIGEAAVEAATAAVADAYVSALAAAEDRGEPPDIGRVLALPSTREAARAAAVEIVNRNGAAFDGSVEAHCSGDVVEVELSRHGHLFRANFKGSACSQR